jgi:hypothetical protein
MRHDVLSLSFTVAALQFGTARNLSVRRGM